jgi:predicted DNA-binding protein (UPF0251 family)
LSPAHREVIDLVYYHEKSIDEVAEIIGIPQNTVKTRMLYARKQISDLMSAQGIDRAALQFSDAVRTLWLETEYPLRARISTA